MNNFIYLYMGGDNAGKGERKNGSSEKKRPISMDDKKNKKQHTDYSKLESGERPRVSPDDLGNLVAEADTDALERYGGVKVCTPIPHHIVLFFGSIYLATISPPHALAHPSSPNSFLHTYHLNYSTSSLFIS